MPDDGQRRIGVKGERLDTVPEECRRQQIGECSERVAVEAPSGVNAFRPPRALDASGAYNACWGIHELEAKHGSAEVALADGAYRVRVRHPARAEALYGVLLICTLPESSGPPARHLMIRIPDNYVTATAGGARSNVYENPMGTYGSFAWRLWLQEMPF